MNELTIGIVAKQTGVAVETIRFYERQGLLAEPARRPSGYRTYAPPVVRRLRFIKRAKALGFSLREIGDLLSLRVDGNSTRADVRARASAKIGEIEVKLRQLDQMKHALESLAASCTGKGPTGECPILEALEKDIASDESIMR